MNKDRQDPFSAVEVLGFVAAGLGGLPHRIGRIEALAAPLAKAAPRDGELRVALQDLDHIRQTVEDLARLATQAGTGDSHSAAALASTLRLEALRNLLVGSEQDEAAGAKTDKGQGRIEFFAGGLGGD
jgi:hypothetical protein